jgi:alpha-D-xyloside xylohydrolase
MSQQLATLKKSTTKIVMRNLLNRRQFGQGLLAGATFALMDNNQAPAVEKASQTIAGSQWEPASPGVWKMTLGSPEAISPVKSRLVPPRTDAMQRLPVIEAPSIEVTNFRAMQRGVTLSLPLAPHERIYGFGLQFFSMDHRGKKCILRVNADPVKDTGDSHAPVPFYVSSRGYGILVDTARYATFYCGDSRPKPRESGSDRSSGLEPIYTKSLREEDASEVLVDIPAAKGVDVYQFAGPTMLDVVRRYNLFSGGGILPPEWGLGFWYRVASSADDKEVAAIAAEFRARGIPCDVLGLESGWHSHAYSCTYSWNQSRFPHPENMLRDLNKQNFHVNLWEHAFIHPWSPLFESMHNLSGDTAVWGGLVPDFQSQGARQVFGDFHGRHLIDIGVSGFKLDECDNSDFTGGWSFAEASRFPSGVDGEQMHSLFGIRYQHALWQPFLDRNQETYSLVRSSGALAAPYPFVLYSDLYDHRQFVRALVNSGFSGLLWCPEVRDAKNEEDFIRRLQTVVFSPLAMINGWYIPNPPWKQLDRKKNNANEFSSNWQHLEERAREILGWRMRLVPYLRGAFARYAKDGTPPFRALVLDWPDCPDLTEIDDAWMVGDRLLVAPLFAGEPEGRTIFLPPGQWFNFWTGERIKGGATLKIPAETRDIPVFVKSGVVLPLAPVTPSTSHPVSNTLEVRVYGDGSLPFELDTPHGSVHVGWDRVTGTGVVRQSGDEAYAITKWTRENEAGRG